MSDINFKQSKQNLTAGICDNCKNVTEIETGDNDIGSYKELYCFKGKIYIEPQPNKFQIKQCDYFDKETK